MELRQLTYFVTVAEELHFGRAAARLHMTQPPLSQQIMALEEELGARLFERTSRSVGLTAEGRFFLKECREVLRHVERAASAVGAMARGEEGSIRVGYIEPSLDGPLPDVIRRFRAASPRVRVTLIQAGTMEQLNLLKQGRIDVGLGSLNNIEVSPFLSTEVYSESYVACLPREHALAMREKVILSQLDQEHLILFPRHSLPGFHDAILSRLREAGAVPADIQEAAGSRTAVRLVAAGLGIAIVPESAMHELEDGVVFRPLSDGFSRLRLGLIYPDEQNSGRDSNQLGGASCSRATRHRFIDLFKQALLG